MACATPDSISSHPNYDTLMTPIRAWQFTHPDFSSPDERPGLQLAPRGGVAMVSDEDAIHQAILILLSTVPGERVMRPDYGCHLRRLLFAPNDDTTAGLAIHYVRQALERWEPRIEIIGLDATRAPESPHRLDIQLRYRIRATGQIQSLVYPFHLNQI